MTHPVRGFLHGTAAALSIVGAVLLTTLASGEVTRRLSLLVFGLSLVGLYSVSTLYHSIPWRPVWKRRWQRIDHTMIHVLVAGTYTPIAFIVLDGWLRVATLAVQWGIVAVGAVHNLVLRHPVRTASIALQTTQGWLALALLWPLADRLPVPAILLIVLGGVLYTAGMVAMVIGRPRLWPQFFSSHEVFHLLVVAGSSVHFAAVARYVAGYGVA
jgi:hemolysin III